MRQSSIFRRCHTTHVVLFDMVNRSIIYTGDSLVAYSAGRVRLKQCLLELASIAARLMRIMTKDFIKFALPFGEALIHSL